VKTGSCLLCSSSFWALVADALLGFVEPEIRSKLHVKNTTKIAFQDTLPHFNYPFMNSHLLIPFLLQLNTNSYLCLTHKLLCHLLYKSSRLWQLGPCYNRMECPQATDGEDSHQIWKITVNILNKQSQTTDKGWPRSVVVVWGDHRSSLQKLYMLQNDWEILCNAVNTELEFPVP